LANVWREASMLTDPVNIPVSMVYADTHVNAAIFRQSALLTHGEYQYTAFYAPDETITLGRRRHDAASWEWERIPHRGNVRDRHNVISIGISRNGLLHVAYDHHNDPLRYRVGVASDSLEVGPEQPMTGQRESRVTYPQFLSSPDGRFYFFYRDGKAHNGDLCLNVYDPDSGVWTPLHHPLIAGSGLNNAYWWRPGVGPDGSLHLAWCWRWGPDHPPPEGVRGMLRNSHVCYATSQDGGLTWCKSDGAQYVMPITHLSAEVVDPVPEGSNLMNQCSSTVDAQGRPHLVHYRNDEAGIPQIIHAYFDGSEWHVRPITSFQKGFSLSHRPDVRSLLERRPLSRPDIAVGSDGTAYVIYRDARSGGRVQVMWASAPSYCDWKVRDLTDFPVGNWEPNYDPVAWREREELHLWVHACGEGWPERGAAGGPQMAYVVQASVSRGASTTPL